MRKYDITFGPTRVRESSEKNYQTVLVSAEDLYGRSMTLYRNGVCAAMKLKSRKSTLPYFNVVPSAGIRKVTVYPGWKSVRK